MNRGDSVVAVVALLALGGAAAPLPIGRDDPKRLATLRKTCYTPSLPRGTTVVEGWDFGRSAT